MKVQKAEVTERLYDTCAFAVVRVPTVERGLEIADGLLRGGVPAMEISYTLPNAGEVISGIQDRFGDDMLVGAGTVMEAATASLAIMVPYAPGCTTVTEAVKGLEMGAAFIKCFPISNTYGVQLVKLFKTPTPWMPLMASGGINLENLSEWVRAGVDTCGMGSLLTKGSAGEIAANAAEVRRIVDETRAEMGE